MQQILPRYFLVAFIVTAAIIPVYGQPHRDDYDLFETEFNWLEIEDIGMPLVEFHDNDFQGPFDIGFRFPFYGEIYENFWVSSNGFIGFGPTAQYTSPNNHQLPSQEAPNNIIAVYWKNLDPEAFWADGTVYYGMRDGKRVIQYQGIGELNVDGVDPANTITMQVILEPDGDVQLQYAHVGVARFSALPVFWLLPAIDIDDPDT